MAAARGEAEKSQREGEAAEQEWKVLRQQLEEQLVSRDRDLQTAAAARAEAADVLQGVKADLQKAVGAQASISAEWDAVRKQLEDHLQKRTEELQAAGRAKVELQMALDGVRAELRLAHDLRATDGKAIESMRDELEQSVRGAAAGDQDRLRLQAAVRDLTLERTHLSAANGVLERQLSDARDRIRQLSEETETFRTRIDAPPEPAMKETAGRTPVERPRAVEAAPAARPRPTGHVEELGKMGAAMAPELESLIAMVDRSASDMLRELDPSSPARAKAQTIAESSERAVSLLKQLASVSRRQTRSAAAAIDLNDVVHRVEPTLVRLTGDEVELTIALGQTATLTLSENDLEQILTALVFSARESLTLGGSILLSTSAFDPNQSPAASASTVTLSATSFGYGVQAAKASPALEHAVRRCGGEITLGGEPDRDAIVQVALPLTTGTQN